MIKQLWILVLSTTMICCRTQSLIYEPEIVVEGFIERDSVARVYLSQTVKTDNVVNPQNIPIFWGKVTITDLSTNEQEVLIGQIDNSYLGYVYKGSSIYGRSNSSYSIKVEYSGKTVTGITSIAPQGAKMTNTRVKKIDDNSCDIITSIEQPKSDLYYIFRVRNINNKRNLFTPSLLGVFQGSAISNSNVLEIHPMPNIFDSMPYTSSFRYTDDIEVQLCVIDRESFDFWTSYQNDVINYSNNFYPSSSNLRSNLRGGLGIWCGYNQSQFRVNIKDSLK